MDRVSVAALCSARPLVGKPFAGEYWIRLSMYAAFRLSTRVQTILDSPAKSNVVDLAVPR
jgi:hypothetical protein